MTGAASTTSIEHGLTDQMFRGVAQTGRKGLTVRIDADLLTVSEAAEHLRISTSLAYELIRQDRLPHLHLGRRIVVPAAALERWVDQAATASLASVSSDDRWGIVR